MATHSQIPPRDDARAKLQSNDTISILETAAVTQYGEQAIRQAVRNGDIAAIRLGRNIRVLSAPLRRQLGIED